MPEAAAGGALWKKVFFKISQNTQETPAPNETPVSFSKFVRTPFFYIAAPDDCFWNADIAKMKRGT